MISILNDYNYKRDVEIIYIYIYIHIYIYNICVYSSYTILTQSLHVVISKAPKDNGIGATGSKNWVWF